MSSMKGVDGAECVEDDWLVSLGEECSDDGRYEFFRVLLGVAPGVLSSWGGSEPMEGRLFAGFKYFK